MNYWLNGALATCSFELRRSFTVQRTAVSFMLALFPPIMLGLLVLGSEFSGDSNARSGVLMSFKLVTIMLVSLVCLLSLLLWATPNVYSELEGKSWSFVASRPGGRISIFLGKFIASFLVSYCISILAITLCVLLAKFRLGVLDAQHLWISLSGLYLFGCAVYAAVFSMIGTFFIRRGMVVAAGYLVGSDIVLASIPGALINKLTIRHHLQEIGISWVGWFVPVMQESEFREVFGESMHVMIHVAIVVGITLLSMAIGSWIIINREYITSDQT